MFFTKAEDPLDADVWLRVVESKFPFSWELALTPPRLALPPNSSVDLQGHGGITFSPCSPLTMW
jgi:hypothetical protein